MARDFSGVCHIFWKSSLLTYCFFFFATKQGSEAPNARHLILDIVTVSNKKNGMKAVSDLFHGEETSQNARTDCTKRMFQMILPSTVAILDWQKPASLFFLVSIGLWFGKAQITTPQWRIVDVYTTEVGWPCWQPWDTSSQNTFAFQAVTCQERYETLEIWHVQRLLKYIWCHNFLTFHWPYSCTISCRGVI